MSLEEALIDGISLQCFSDWAVQNGVASSPLKDATLLSGGHSNLNIKLDFGQQEMVLRRPPLGHIMETAHNMEREFTVLKALNGTDVPVPQTLYVEPNVNPETGVDAPFFLMDFISASSLNSPADNDGKSPDQLHAASIDLARTLASLHAIDPADVGLEKFGRPEGYLERQVKRWAKQLEASRSRETPLLDRLVATIPEAPKSDAVSIVHGDYKMNNALIDFGASTPKIAAILDWEMATLGDPHADLAMFGLYWTMPDKDEAIKRGFISPVDTSLGYPQFEELLEEYEKAAARPLPDMDWYWAFAALKIGVITESLHYRYHINAARGEGFEMMADMTEPIARIGLEALKRVNGRA